MCKIPVYLPMKQASQDSSPQSVAEVILSAYCVKTEGYQTPALSTECSSQLPAPRYLVNGKTGKAAEHRTCSPAGGNIKVCGGNRLLRRKFISREINLPYAFPRKEKMWVLKHGGKLRYCFPHDLKLQYLVLPLAAALFMAPVNQTENGDRIRLILTGLRI